LIQENHQIDRFKQQLRDSLQRETLNAHAITIAKHAHVYTCGDPGETVYFIESGQVKLLTLSPEGRERLLAIHTAGDIFGELCLSGLGARLETAIAVEETVLKKIPYPRFFAQLSRDGLFEGFVQRLAVRIADRQQVIANMAPVDSEQRLGKALLQPAYKQGKPARVIDRDLGLQHFARFGDSSESLGQAVEQTADSVIITDKEGFIEYVNPAFETTTGYSREDALGKTPRILKSGEHDEEFYQKLWSQILSGQPYRGTIINRKKTGETYWSEQTITPMKDDDGDIAHFVSVLKDVTELIQNHKHETEMRLARAVQQRFYRRTVTLPGFDLCAGAYPADETGGDYVDFIPMPEDCLGIAIGDISGHGFDSALVMAETRAYLRAFAKTSRDLGEILTQVNRAILEDFEETKYVTLLLACIDPRNRSLVYANAGHVSGYLLRSSGEVGCVMESLSLPLGFFPNAQYSASNVLPLGSGEIVALLTDGITEMAAPEEVEFFEAKRAIRYIGDHRQESAEQIIEGLYQTARAFAQDQPQKDDISLVVFKVI
jgi:PAS domain S-box-containing protein